MGVLKPPMGASGLVYLKEKGREAYTSSAALTVPGNVTTHRLRTEGGKYTSKFVLENYGVCFASQTQDCSFDGFTKWIK